MISIYRLKYELAWRKNLLYLSESKKLDITDFSLKIKIHKQESKKLASLSESKKLAGKGVLI
jgi:hypothetical protein